MDLQLAGKRALVTGASSGIGRGIAQVLGREGVTVVVHGRNPERTEATAQAIRSTGGSAFIAIGDLATDAGAAAVAKAVQDHAGGLDILVNNIGGTEASGGGAGLGGALRLFYLPPYSPDRNPDELVWKHLKADTVGRASITSLADFRKKVKSSMLSLQRNAEKIRSFFQKPSLKYTA